MNQVSKEASELAASIRKIAISVQDGLVNGRAIQAGKNNQAWLCKGRTRNIVDIGNRGGELKAAQELLLKFDSAYIKRIFLRVIHVNTNDIRGPKKAIDFDWIQRRLIKDRAIALLEHWQQIHELLEDLDRGREPNKSNTDSRTD